METPLITRFMGPTWGLSGADRAQMGPVLAPWTLLSETFALLAHREVNSPAKFIGHKWITPNKKPVIISVITTLIYSLLPTWTGCWTISLVSSDLWRRSTSRRHPFIQWLCVNTMGKKNWKKTCLTLQSAVCLLSVWHSIYSSTVFLTLWGRVTHICVSNLTIIGSDNGFSTDRCQAIIWTNAGILLISGPLGTNFSEILIEISFLLKSIFFIQPQYIYIYIYVLILFPLSNVFHVLLLWFCCCCREWYVYVTKTNIQISWDTPEMTEISQMLVFLSAALTAIYVII